MDRNDSSRPNERPIHLKVSRYSPSAVIAVDEQEVQRSASKSLCDEPEGGRVMGIRPQEEDPLSKPAEGTIEQLAASWISSR